MSKHHCQYCNSIITENYLSKSKITCRRCTHYWKKYKIRVSDYNKMLSDQDGKCAICGTETAGTPSESFCVDHCHTTENVRGLLCVNCNTGIGSLKEDPDIFQKALNYLCQHQTK